MKFLYCTGCNSLYAEMAAGNACRKCGGNLVPYCDDSPAPTREVCMADLSKAWDEYVTYARSCIEAGTFPAPFGATQEEQLLKSRIAAATARR